MKKQLMLWAILILLIVPLHATPGHVSSVTFLHFRFKDTTDNEFALKLLSAFGPLSVTSANVHGESTPYVIKDIKNQLNSAISLYIDSGILDAKPSTIVDLTLEKPRIIREGSITLEEILDAI